MSTTNTNSRTLTRKLTRAAGGKSKRKDEKMNYYSKRYSREELEALGYTYHHAASERGYGRVALHGTVRPYSGRFGAGVVRMAGRYHGSTMYRAIEYWTVEG